MILLTLSNVLLLFLSIVDRCNDARYDRLCSYQAVCSCFCVTGPFRLHCGSDPQSITVNRVRGLSGPSSVPAVPPVRCHGHLPSWLPGGEWQHDCSSEDHRWAAPEDCPKTPGEQSVSLCSQDCRGENILKQLKKETKLLIDLGNTSHRRSLVLWWSVFSCLSAGGLETLKQKSLFTTISCARLRLEMQFCSSIRRDNEAVGGLPVITDRQPESIEAEIVVIIQLLILPVCAREQ